MFEPADQVAINTIARSVAQAWRTGVSIGASDLPPLHDQAMAYAVQQLVSGLMGWDDRPGERRLWKVGGPNTNAIPTAACLPGSLTHESGASMSLSHPGLIGFEPEVAVRIASVDFDSGEARVQVGACCVAIEVVASRFTDTDKLDPNLKLADQQMNAALILGSWCELPAMPWDAIGCTVTCDGMQIGASGSGHPCGDPLWALAWLASHARRFGRPLRAGDVVTTGSWLGMIPTEKSGLYEVCFDGLVPKGLDAVSVQFS